MRAAPGRHRDHVCSPVAAGVDDARSSDAQGIDGLHDRGRDGAGGDRYRALLLSEISQDRFRGHLGHTLAGGGTDDRVDLAGAVAEFLDWRGTGAGADRRRDPALAPLPLARGSAEYRAAARADRS